MIFIIHNGILLENQREDVFMTQQDYISNDETQAEEQRKDALDQEKEFLSQVQEQCKSINDKGHESFKQFTNDSFRTVTEQAANSLAQILDDLKAANRKRSFMGKMVGYLPAPAQKVINKGRKEATVSKVSNGNIAETTDEIFKQLDGEIGNLKEQQLRIGDIQDHINVLLRDLIQISDAINERYSKLAEEGAFEYNSRLKYEYEQSINDISVRIENFKQQTSEIYQAAFACEQTLSQINKTIPHLRAELISGLATSSFINTISSLQQNAHSLVDSISEINLANSAQNQSILLSVTDTTAQTNKQIDTIKKQHEIRNKTKEGISRNFKNNMAALGNQNKLLVGFNEQNNEEMESGDSVYHSPKQPKHTVTDFSKIRSISHKKDQTS